MFLTRGVRRLAVAGLVVAVAVGPFLSSPVAHGDAVGDLQARAAQISAQISALQSTVMADTNAVESARYKASQIDSQIAASKKKLVAARSQESSSRHELSQYALQAYVTGGSSGQFASLLGTSGDEIGQRNGYMTAAVGDRQQLVDNLQASQQVTEEQTKALQGAQSQAKTVQAQAEAKQASAQRAASQLASIKSQLDGQLAHAVAAKQAAAQHAAEARARAAAQAQANAAAQAQAQASRSAVTTPRAAVTIPQVAPTPPTPSAPSAPSNPAPSTSSGGSTGGSTGGGGFVPPPNASAAAIAVAAARSQLGVPYLWGGTRPGVGLDCSGLTQYAYAQAGISLPRVTYAQERAGRVVPLSQIQPGDLVFYWNGGHVALYVGGGTVIHAPHTGTVVRYGSLYMGPPELVVRPTG